MNSKIQKENSGSSDLAEIAICTAALYNVWTSPVIMLNVEITGFELKLTANKNYRSTGVVTVGDRLGAGVKDDRGWTAMFFLRDTFVLTAEYYRSTVYFSVF
jgi:hypothetical protein